MVSRVSTPSSSPAAHWNTLVVVNVGRPGEDAWFERLPRLDYDEVVETV
jgi:3-hydroxypropanoate dehydrogenase